MKKYLLGLSIFTLASSAFATPPQCVSGKIQFVKYNGDNTMTIKVQEKELYTNRQGLQSLLFSAFITGINTTIYTKDCFKGGGFAEVVFENK